LAGEQTSQPFAEQDMVVYEQHSKWHCLSSQKKSEFLR